MATVTEILAVASKVSALRASAGEPEVDIALMAINRAYQRACLDTELTGADVSYTASASASALAASSIAGASVMRVQHLRLVSSQNVIPVQQVSRQELQDNRAVDDTQGTPVMYSVAMVGGTPTVDFHPNLQTGDVIKMSYLATPATLTTASTTPTHLPEMFHHDILTNAAIASLLERDEAGSERAGTYHARSLEALQRLDEYLGQMGGTANRSYTTPGARNMLYPDVRLR